MHVPSHDFIPPPAEAVDLPVEELGLALLRLIVEGQQGHLLTRGNAGNYGYWEHHSSEAIEPPFLEALSEPYDWLLHRGLVALQPGNESGWCYVTRRGLSAIEDENPLARLRADDGITARLHPAIRQQAREQILLGRWANAVFVSLREVEVRVRDLSGLNGIGVDLMAAALNPRTGPLRDPGAGTGEQEAMMALFRGAFGTFRNATGHRQVEFPDPDYAVEVVALADLLHRILDQVEARLSPSPGETQG
jgi:uncharacterized protein (TIGR02391 family)